MSKPIEEMTLKEIRELKKRFADRIGAIVNKELAKFEDEHGIPADVTVHASRYACRSESGAEISYSYEAEVDVTLMGEHI